MSYNYKAIKVNGKKIDEHRHVMQEHLGRKLSRHEVVHHINGDPRDNRIENLELIDYKKHNNIHKTYFLTNHSKGEDSHRAKLKEKDIVEIRKLHKAGFKVKDISKIYPVSHQTISKIIHRKLWKHVA